MSSDMQMRPLSLNGNRVTMATDTDDATDEMLFRDNVTWSKGRLRRAKIMSMITGNRQPTRRKIFSEIRESEDWKFWNIDVHGKSIQCAKIYNPAVLLQRSFNTLPNIASVQRLEIEDPEGILRTVPRQLFLQIVRLESLLMTWTKIKTLPDGLFQLPLNSLYLQRNQIKSLNGIERAASLTILDVSNNKLDTLPKTFGQLVNLVTLNLSGNNLHELPDSIGSLGQLKALDCSCNKLRSVPDTIGSVLELTSLDLSNNQLTGLPETLGGLPNLEDLRLRSNQLRSLPANFGQLRRLNSLLLRNNKFEAVPRQLSNLTNLQNLNMRENAIRSMENPIASLKYLVLDSNQLSMIDVGIIGSANLQLLSLKHNRITEINEDVCRLQGLRSLHLSENEIDVIPRELTRLVHLRRLSVSATKIQTIPLEVACMPSLTTLELDDCTELDGYLKMEYKNKGLAGVIEYLKKNQAYEDFGMPVGAGGSKPLVDLTRGTMMFSPQSTDSEPVVYRSSKTTDGDQLRNLAGLSIVPGTSCPPPHSEAANLNGVGIVHIARESICPTDGIVVQSPTPAPRPSTESRGRVAVRTPQAEVIETLPEFGDLISTTTVDEQTQQRQLMMTKTTTNQASLDLVKEEEEEDDDEMSELYARVTRKSKPPGDEASVTADSRLQKPATRPKPSLSH